MKQQLNARISESTRQKLDVLTRRYGTQAEALSVAIDRLYQQEATAMSRKRTYSDLQELTGHEAGAILHPNGEIVITKKLRDESTPNRKQFAEVLADAVAQHTSIDGEIVVTYSRHENRFYWGSAAGVGEGEVVVVEDVRPENYGNVDASQEDMAAYFAEEANELWSEVMINIEYSEDND